MSTIDFGLDILLYAIENFDEFIQKIFDNLFKDAELPGGPAVIFGEIRGDGMVIDDSPVVSEEIIDECVDRESEEVQNSVVVKTMRCQVSDVLGSQITIDLLEQIEGAPSEIYDTPMMKFVDYLWERNYRKALAFNLIYIVYPLILSLITITAQERLNENRVFGLILTIFLFLIEVYQMYIGGLEDYFTTIQNVFDFCGITSTIVFYAFGHLFTPRLALSCIIFGLVGSFYKGIMSMGILSEKFRVLIKLLQNSLIDMVPFTVILVAQMLLFAGLSSAQKLSEKFSGNKLYQDQDSIYVDSFLEYYMIMFGDNPQKKSLDNIQWALLIGYTFLVNVLNLNLLISIIGDTFEQVQSTQNAMNYKMKADSLLELAGMQKWEREIEDMKYLHWFVYKDEEGNPINDAWGGKVKKLEGQIAAFQKEAQDFQD